jgi:hypothetical protein
MRYLVALALIACHKTAGVPGTADDVAATTLPSLPDTSDLPDAPAGNGPTKLDTGFPISHMAYLEVAAYDTSVDPHTLLIASGERIYPVLGGSVVTNAMVLFQATSGWTLREYGQFRLAQRLHDLRAQVLAATPKATNIQLVNLPHLFVRAVTYDDNGELMFVPLADAYGLASGVALPATQALAALAPIAVTAKPGRGAP